MKSFIELKESFKKWLYFSNYDVIDVVCATTIINRKREIDPVWLFLVDPPSSGKTEVLRAFTDPEFIIELSKFTSKSLISGKTSRYTFGTDKDPSLFAKIDGKLLIIKDFTTILEMNKNDQQEIFSLLRDAYDGSCGQKFGMDENIYHYKTHFGVLGGVTLAIDRNFSMTQDLGERFLKYRINNNHKKAQEKARENRNHKQEMREELNLRANTFLKEFQLTKTINYLPEQEIIIETIAEVVSKLRTPVNRNWQDWDIIEVSPESEVPIRLQDSLKNLADGLAMVRGRTQIEQEDIETIAKVGFDSLPRKLTQILQVLVRNEAFLLHSVISQQSNFNTPTVTRILEDFFAIGITEMDKSNKNVGYKSRLHPDFRSQINLIQEYLPKITLKEPVQQAIPGTWDE